MKRIFSVLLAALFLFSFAFAEETEEEETVLTPMVITADFVNGRSRPSKRSFVEAVFDKGDPVIAHDWSPKHHWIEVDGGESGTVWVWYEYLTERTDEFAVYNDWGTRIKIRKEPFGKVIGYLKKDGELYIDQVILGWGHCDRGWVDLKYFVEED